ALLQSRGVQSQSSDFTLVYPEFMNYCARPRVGRHAKHFHLSLRIVRRRRRGMWGGLASHFSQIRREMGHPDSFGKSPQARARNVGWIGFPLLANTGRNGAPRFFGKSPQARARNVGWIGFPLLAKTARSGAPRFFRQKP